ncbi:secondary thiamine-phosphate synthase enzyme YjbQ [candidate division WOR-3 bacterium]|nr:secondary thiamine-phosphate synthase enzyme YjbQ [candidate division WOR-3 bacterium]
MIYSEYLNIKTNGFSDIINITDDIQRIAANSNVLDGMINVFVTGSTASVSTIEFEPALVEDVKEQLEKMISKNLKTRHSETWGDDNGFSHIRATLMGPGIVVPLTNGKLVLGTWQQIIIIDHDNRPRDRKIYIQIMGE